MNFISFYTRWKNKRLLKGKKADYWVCCEKGLVNGSKETTCFKCGALCYYYPIENKDMLKRGAKKICIDCGLKEDIPDNMRKVLERTR